MKKIKVKFVDAEAEQRNFLPILEKYFDVEISDSPDFAFFDYTMWHKCLDYDCVRIVGIGENCRPDFNLFDYAIGFDDLTFGDRFCRFPLFAWPTYAHPFLDRAAEKHNQTEEEIAKRTEFCTFIVSNGGNSDPVREKMFRLLSTYKQVDSGGGFLNNLPNGRRIKDGKEWDEFMNTHKFSLAFENSRCNGYITEKLIKAFAGGTIPIYWGAPDVTDIFNPKAFICVNDDSEKSLNQALNRVMEIDQDRDKYLEILREPIFAGYDDGPEYIKEGHIEDFLKHIFEQDPKNALRRTNYKYGWGKFYERDAKRHREMDDSSVISMLYRIERKIGLIKGD